MTDELTPEQEDAVRRLLAQARHDGPVPGEVADRLDQVLEGLVVDAETAAEDDDLEVFESGRPGVVTELAGVRHRRRNAGRLLLVAAAVLVGGVAVGQNLGGVGVSDGDDAAPDSAAADAPRDSSNRAGDEAGTAASGDGSSTPTEADVPVASGALGLLDSVRAPLRLTSDNFAADVQLQLGRTADQRRQAANADFDGVFAYAAKNGDFECADGVYGEGATLPAYYDAEEAVLVLRRPRAGFQRVDLLTCGTAVQLNSVELPAH